MLSSYCRRISESSAAFSPRVIAEVIVSALMPRFFRVCTWSCIREISGDITIVSPGKSRAGI